MSIRLLRTAAHTLLLMLLVALGTLVLVRYAPGYFADSRELDSEHANGVRAQLNAQRARDYSALAMARAFEAGWLHGDPGVSRQYGVAVGELIRPCLPVTLSLVARSLGFGWLAAVALALPLSAAAGRAAGGLARAGDLAIALGSAALLAVPIGALATLFLLADTGGPALAMGLVIGARDFKFLYRLLGRQRQAPYLLFARAQGIGPVRVALAHLLPAVAPQLLALLTMSFVLALSLAVPAEVIFDLPGLGQLAWRAAVNRDAPVLLSVTLIMAATVGLASASSAVWLPAWLPGALENAAGPSTGTLASGLPRKPRCPDSGRLEPA
jgi:peptide/nickel transport system permease protein